MDRWIGEASDESQGAFEQEKRKLKKLRQRAFQHDQKKWVGFFGKLGDSGGYMTATDEARIHQELECEREALRNDHVKGSYDAEGSYEAIPLDIVTEAEKAQILGVSRTTQIRK
eukprot:TRINITY_DN1441_c0_g1_i12.p2 TRINITY_DN1441_c0_g1~~TRINITY_DN1441_c0_g1_i12.p2  ORF type:complete len:114 (-),score=13.81 TRINITY_DN1441_c0_g1_i12:226-567(-)